MAQDTVKGVGDAVDTQSAAHDTKHQHNAPMPTTTATSAPAIQPDSILEYDSMVLMSKLEQFVIRLSDKTVQSSATLALEYLAELTNSIVAFAEQLPSPERKLSFETLLAKDHQNYTQLGPQHLSENRLSFQDHPELLQAVMNEPKMFNQLSNDILRVINIYLSVNVKAFHTPGMEDQWKTLYTGFYKHLVSAVREVHTTQNG